MAVLGRNLKRVDPVFVARSTLALCCNIISTNSPWPFSEAFNKGVAPSSTARSTLALCCSNAFVPVIKGDHQRSPPTYPSGVYSRRTFLLQQYTRLTAAMSLRMPSEAVTRDRIHRVGTRSRYVF